MHRRQLIQSLVSAGAVSAITSGVTAEDKPGPVSIVDTNVHLFQWPFRRLPLDELPAFRDKFRQLGIHRSWAGSFEALLHRDMTAVNSRLVEACHPHPDLVPVGAIHLGLPGWEFDFRRCASEYRMQTIRLYPGYHGYGLDDVRFRQLLERAASSQVLVQVVVTLEDTRTQHPRVRIPDVDVAPLPKVIDGIKNARVQLLGARLRGTLLSQLAEVPEISFDTSRVEGTDGIAELLKRAPANRVRFGSHAPFLVPEAALIRVAESRLSESQRRTVLGGA